MSRHASLINRAVGVALTSQCRWRHGCVIARGSRVVVHSPNVHRNDPSNGLEGSSFHAEEAALRELCRATGRTYGHGTFKGYTLYVARVNARNGPALSRPCAKCWDLLLWNGFRDIFYTNEFGGLSHETVIDDRTRGVR